MFRVRNERHERYLAVAVPLLAAVFLLTTSPVMMNWYDVHYFEEWYRVAMSKGLLHIYPECEKVHYPPMAVVFYITIRDLIHNLGLDSNLWTFQFSLKVFLVAFYLLTCLIIIREFEWPIAQWGVISVPMGMVVWGYQFDTIIAFFLALTAVCVRRGRSIAAGVSLALASSFKYVPGILVIPFTLILKEKYGSRPAKIFFLTSAITVALLWSPFILYDPEAFWKQAFLFHMLRLPQDLTPLNIPLLLTRWHVYPYHFIVGKLSGPLIILGFVTLALWLWKHREILQESIRISGLKHTIWGSAALFMLWFALTTKVGNPYYISWIYLWVFPFAVWLLPSWCVGFLNTAPFLLAFSRLPAAVCNAPVFVPEDVRWYPALQLLGFSTPLAVEKAHHLYLAAPNFMRLWYYHMHQTELVLVVIYTIVVTKTLLDLLKWMRDPKPADERPHDWAIHPVLLAFTLPAYIFALYIALPIG